ncbi:MAG TPA: monofunctional biosynthetic peptidoglycan transglycosylase [Sphingobacteriaceae bacterium]
MRSKKKKKASTKRSALSLVTKCICWFLGVSVCWVLVCRFVDPPVTWLMIQRGLERKAEGKPWKADREWRDLDEISSNLKRAALAGEDAAFRVHYGFDLAAIQAAYEKNQEGGRIRGGSTISQQTAKNVFLWPGRSWLRKGLEAYFTVLIELLWGKERILEVYLNVIETGDGIYGVESACQAYFGKSSESLSRGQAALLVSVLPNPRRWTPVKPTRYLYRRQLLIMRNMSRIGPVPF